MMFCEGSINSLLFLLSGLTRNVLVTGEAASVGHGAKRGQLLDRMTTDTEDFVDWGTHSDKGGGEQTLLYTKYIVYITK
jgi:hypothetical protein